MIKEKIAIMAPSGWSEVTISQYQELQKLPKDEFYDVGLISILCGVDEDVVSRLTQSTYSSVLLSLHWLNKMPAEASYKPILKVGDKEYGLVKMSSFTNGEWYSIEKWLEDPAENLHKLLALIYRPLITAINDDYRIVEAYNSEEAVARQELFKNLMVEDLYGAFVFFYHIEKECTKTIRDYLQIQVVMTRMKIPKKIKNWMLRRSLTRWRKGNGHGIPFFTPLLKGILERSKKSPDTTLYSPSLTKPLK